MSSNGAKQDRGEESYRRYLDGDESAFEELVELYFEELILFANGYVRDMHASEEIALDSMLELMIHHGRYSFRSSLKTYLFAVARHKAIDRVRKHSRERTVPIDEATGIGEDTLTREVFRNEVKRRVLGAVDELPPDQRAAVYLVYIEGMSYEEAGNVLKKSRKQMDNLLTKAKRRLRDILGEEGAELIKEE